MKDRLQIIARLPNATVHLWCEIGLVFSHKNGVYVVRDLECPRPELVVRIPWRPAQHLAGIRLLDRVLKYGILQVHRTTNGWWLMSNRESWWRCVLGGDVETVSSFSVTRPMNRGICESATGPTYIADYVPNRERKDPIRIHRTEDLRTFEVAWEFGPGQIRHVHALVPDPEEQNRIWVLTGDYDCESSLLYTDDDFRTVNRFLNVGQCTRATDLTVRNGWLVWGMDSPDETSHILTVPKTRPEALESLLKLPGPAYYMGRNSSGAIYLGTTVEPGAAVKDKYGRIFALRRDGTWEDVLRRRHDILPQHGVFYFPRGVMPENFVVFSQRGLTPQEGYLTIARDREWY